MLIDAADTRRSISLGQARVLIRQLVAGLQNAGLQRGDCVCVHSFNDIYYPILFLGIIAAGGVFAGTNPSYTQYELEHHIKTAKIQYLITEPEMLEQIQAAAKAREIYLENLWIFNPLPDQKCPDGFKSWQELLKQGEKDWVRFDDFETCKTTVAARFFSSGTTGLPKAVSMSHHNLVAQHELCFEGPNKRPYEVSTTN